MKNGTSYRRLTRRQLSERAGGRNGRYGRRRARRGYGAMAKLREDLQGISPVAKRELFETLVERVEIYLATKNAEVALRLPLWASGKDSPMRPAHSSASLTYYETHRRSAIRLGLADCRCEHDPSHRNLCYRCRRRRAVHTLFGKEGRHENALAGHDPAGGLGIAARGL